MLLTVFRNLSKRGRQRQRREARKIFLSNPHILLSISLLWLPVCFYYRWNFWLQCLLLNETMDASSWNVGHVWKTAWGNSWTGRHKCQLYFAYSRALFVLLFYRCCPRRPRLFCLKVPKLYQHSFLVYVKAKNINWRFFSMVLFIPYCRKFQARQLNFAIFIGRYFATLYFREFGEFV